MGILAQQLLGLCEAPWFSGGRMASTIVMGKEPMDCGNSRDKAVLFSVVWHKDVKQ